MLGLAAVPAVIQLIGFLFFLPESPRWLVGHSRVDDARRVLMRLRSSPAAVDVEMEQIEVREFNSINQCGLSHSLCFQKSFVGSSSSPSPWRDVLRNRSLRNALIVGMSLQASSSRSHASTFVALPLCTLQCLIPCHAHRIVHTAVHYEFTTAPPPPHTRTDRHPFFWPLPR